MGKKLCAKFNLLLEETELMATAIDVISETYLGSEDILFSDIRATLDTEISNLRVTAGICEQLAALFNLEPITAEGFTPGDPLVDAKAKQLVYISRAEALVYSSDLRKFKEALQRAYPELGKGEA